jgi:hypothetical protein
VIAIEALQHLQRKREVAGTSRIEGAELTDREPDAALAATPSDLETRSQRPAAAAVATYRWIARLPSDRPVDAALIRETHRRLGTGCDDDHCPPGIVYLRERGAITWSEADRTSRIDLDWPTRITETEFLPLGAIAADGEGPPLSLPLTGMEAHPAVVSGANLARR